MIVSVSNMLLTKAHPLHSLHPEPPPRPYYTRGISVLFPFNDEREEKQVKSDGCGNPYRSEEHRRTYAELENYHRIRSVPTLPKTELAKNRNANTKKKNTDWGGMGGGGDGGGRMQPSAHSASLIFSYLISSSSLAWQSAAKNVARHRPQKIKQKSSRAIKRACCLDRQEKYHYNNTFSLAEHPTPAHSPRTPPRAPVTLQ